MCILETHAVIKLSLSLLIKVYFSEFPLTFCHEDMYLFHVYFPQVPIGFFIFFSSKEHDGNACFSKPYI